VLIVAATERELGFRRVATERTDRAEPTKGFTKVPTEEE
jgi:hypothetical protein